MAFYDVVSIDGPAELLYPLPWSETPATSFLLTPEATLHAIGAPGFVMQSERDESREALGWFQRIIGAAAQGPNLAVVMTPRIAVMTREACARETLPADGAGVGNLRSMARRAPHQLIEHEG